MSKSEIDLSAAPNANFQIESEAQNLEDAYENQTISPA